MVLAAAWHPSDTPCLAYFCLVTLQDNGAAISDQFTVEVTKYSSPFRVRPEAAAAAVVFLWFDLLEDQSGLLIKKSLIITILDYNYYNINHFEQRRKSGTVQTSDSETTGHCKIKSSIYSSYYKSEDIYAFILKVFSYSVISSEQGDAAGHSAGVASFPRLHSLSVHWGRSVRLLNRNQQGRSSWWENQL